MAGHVHKDATAVLQVGHRRRCGVTASDVDRANVTDHARVDLSQTKTKKIGGSGGGTEVRKSQQ